MAANVKEVRAYKNHICGSCKKVIQRGETYLLFKGKFPKYDSETEQQSGIEYLNYKMCMDCEKNIM